MSDIFISYASAGPRQSQASGGRVGEARLVLVVGPHHSAGKDLDEVIEAALNEARCVIVLWSRNSVQSHWVRTEADEAKRRGILVPALIDDVNIPLAFKRIQAANLIGWSGAPSAEFYELAQAIAAVFDPRSFALAARLPIFHI